MEVGKEKQSRKLLEMIFPVFLQVKIMQYIQQMSLLGMSLVAIAHFLKVTIR